MPTTDAPAITSAVRRQYEQYPYPRRNPEDERKRLLMTGLDDLAPLNYYCYRGRRDFRRGFRALIAGGGTGDSVTFLAHQLRGTDAKIVYVDLSAASLAVARKRIETRGLGAMVEWIQGSLLDVPSLGLKPFDFVNCSGVLHHLPDPPAGLAALRRVLKPDGALGLMVYGLYGRTGVYQMQEMMRLINGDESNQPLKLDRTQAMLRSLPPTNWFSRGQELFSSDTAQNDIECYDLFLHSQDRAYSVPQLYDFLAAEGLHLQEFCMDRRALYNPMLLIGDPGLRQTIAALPKPKQQAIAELLCGSIIKHSFWATPEPETHANDLDPDNVPAFTRLADIQQMQSSILKCPEPTWSFELTIPGGMKVRIALERTPHALRFIERINGRRAMGELTGSLMADFGISQKDAWHAALGTLNVLKSADLLLLHHRSTPIPNGTT